MCGIWALLKASLTHQEKQDCVNALLARGPEYSTVQDLSGITLGFTRLAINGLTEAGNQPFNQDNFSVVCNGEIYNYKTLAERWAMNLPEGTSDCAVLPYLASKLSMTALCRTLDGVFAFVLVDTNSNIVYVARDPYGVRPLFQATLQNKYVWSSEIKGLPKDATDVAPFPPGTWRSFDLITGNHIESFKYHTVPHVKLALFKNSNQGHIYAKHALKVALETAVEKRLLSDRPIGALLSGGLDSSLIASIASSKLRKLGKQLNTFSIGMPGSWHTNTKCI